MLLHFYSLIASVLVQYKLMMLVIDLEAALGVMKFARLSLGVASLQFHSIDQPHFVAASRIACRSSVVFVLKLSVSPSVSVGVMSAKALRSEIIAAFDVV